MSISSIHLGLFITGQLFGVVMVGLGIIALAGIVVNNNLLFFIGFGGGAPIAFILLEWD
ncbi:MAG: hypothetical protein ABFS45_09345 [Pseudomonadota bacterium]